MIQHCGVSISFFKVAPTPVLFWNWLNFNMIPVLNKPSRDPSSMCSLNKSSKVCNYFCLSRATDRHKHA